MGNKVINNYVQAMDIMLREETKKGEGMIHNNSNIKILNCEQILYNQ